MMRKILFLPLLVLCFYSFQSFAEDEQKKYKWPIEIEGEKGSITTLYQPQLESFEKGYLEGRMALTIKPTEGETIFGALWFKAKMFTDFEARTVLLQELDIVKTHFPGDIDSVKKANFEVILINEIESWNLEMSLDRILASLSSVENQNELSDKIDNTPPNIFYRSTPAVLVLIDGEPIFKSNTDLGIDYVVNSPFFIVRESGKEKFYLRGGQYWYTSEGIISGWEETERVPESIVTFATSNETNTESNESDSTFTSAPEVIISKKAAELILVDGEVEYKPIDSTTLLYVDNSENDIIMDINSQNHYVLIAGRWFVSSKLDDHSWTFCEPDSLPAEFSKIPEGSTMETVLPNVPGTPEADIALLEHTIPQTATIDRNTATVTVNYDGAPKFAAIEGTEVSYALNSAKTVLLINELYYCVDDAVWFISGGPSGPWVVCDEIPTEIDSLPPDSPVYHVKYTYVYESTPDVVYVGYTPGYNHSYVYGGVVVYGTGYYYPYWYGHYYYPRPVTWGYGVHYNPYTGWGFSVGISYGWIGWGYHPYYSCYWGPRGYHGGYRYGYGRGHRHGYHRGYRAGYAAGNRHGHKSSRNVYSNRNSGVKQTSNRNMQGQGTRNVNSRARSSAKSNNMYTDKKGNVYQRNNQGDYDRKSNRSNQKPSTNQQTKPSQPNKSYDRQQLDRSYQNRSQGNQNYNRSQQQRSGGGNYGGGNRSGGGGRRR